MKSKLLLLLVAACLVATPAFAQVNGVNVKQDASQSATVTTSAAECVKPQANIETLFLFNNGTTTIWIRPEDGTEPTANGAGSTPITTNSGLWWPLGSAPRTGFHCIAITSSDTLTVITGQ